ncbi:O-antigen ligase family protein [Pontibacter sp. G13]|uniref:O-antigen ligase family protein n=1 Tax=Pontibacter sp. G13 TaxID=3074898 RepID=UPI00288B2F41|nr:O-antigen ligase family protein [Pontibacter sp. G13]WNJ16877.1 O-antigen ligase family protein [Pontibacter sp. G13]
MSISRVRFQTAPSFSIVYQGCLMLMAIGIPFSRALMGVSTGALLLLALIHPFLQRETPRPLNSNLMAWLGIWMGVLLLHSFTVGDFAQNWRVFSRIAPLFVVPLSMIFLPQLSKIEWRRVAMTFVASVWWLGIWCLAKALWLNGQAGTLTWKAISYVNLLDHVNSHPTYFSLMMNTAWVLFAWLIWDRNGSWHTKKAAVSLLIGGSLTGGLMILAASRVQILIFLSICMGGGFLYALIHYNLRKGLMAAATVMAIGILAAVSHPNTRDRMADIFEVKQEIPIEKLTYHGIAVREYIWGIASELIAENPMGYGLGQSQRQLEALYAEQGFRGKGMNAHNQYLESALAIGIPGLIIMLIGGGYLLLWAFKTRNFVLFAFLGLMAMSNLTESILQRQVGVMIFGFMAGLLIQTPSLHYRTIREMHLKRRQAQQETVPAV